MPKPTVVLLHGQPDSSASFWPLRRALRATLPGAVRVVAPDRPGYGANPAPATDFAGNAAWLSRFLDRIDAGPAVLVGHSWAGAVAIWAAGRGGGRRLPDERIAGLVLLSSIGPDCLLPIDPVLAAPVLGAVMAFAALGVGRSPVTRKAARFIRPHLAEEDVPYAWASGAAMRRRPLWRSFHTEQRAMVGGLAELSRILPQLDVPTLIVNGSNDQVIPVRTPEALAAAIPGAQRIVIAGGHDLQLRQPVATADQVSRLVDRIGLGR